MSSSRSTDQPETRIVDRRAGSKDRRATKVSDQLVVGGAEALEPRDVREVAVMVCLGCWDGVIPWPPYHASGRVRDLGFDFWYESRPVVRAHRCSGAKYSELEDLRANAEVLKATFPAGNWKSEVLILPQTMYDQLLAWGGVKPGRPITDPRIRRGGVRRPRKR